MSEEHIESERMSAVWSIDIDRAREVNWPGWHATTTEDALAMVEMAASVLSARSHFMNSHQLAEAGALALVVEAADREGRGTLTATHETARTRLNWLIRSGPQYSVYVTTWDIWRANPQWWRRPEAPSRSDGHTTEGITP